MAWKKYNKRSYKPYKKRKYTPRRKKYTRSSLNIETKTVDRNHSFSGIGGPILYHGSQINSGNFRITYMNNAPESYFQALLNGIDSGSSSSQRNGRKVSMKRIDINLDVANLTTTETYRFFRVLVVYVKKNITGLKLGDLLETGGVRSYRRMDTVDHYEILHDKVHNMEPNGRTMKKINIPLKNKECIYSGNGITLGDIMTGALIFAFIPSDGIDPVAASQQNPTTVVDGWHSVEQMVYRFDARLKYNDL